MKKTIFFKLTILVAILLVFNACKKDYIIGGTIEDLNIYMNTSTYDVLKADPLYDTLIQVIDAGGLKDKINEQNSTFFAPSDYSILLYLNSRTIVVQNTINANSKFALDSLLYYVKNNIRGTKDSILLYTIPKSLGYSDLTNNGAKYATGLAGDTVVVSYEYTTNSTLGYTSLVSGTPQVVYFTQLWQPFTISPTTPASTIPATTGVRTIVKTSGMKTLNGYLNALTTSHQLFFYGTKK